MAIEEPRLLRPWFYGTGEEGDDFLSLPQRVVLKAAYGCDLSPDLKDARGFSEVDHFWASQGHGEYDDLGNLLGVKAPGGAVYVPREYRETWAVCGIRAGKSDRLAATITAYEAVCGGHEGFIRPGRQAICFQIAQDLKMAKYSLHSIRATLESMPFIAAPYAGGARIKNVTADRIDLWNGMTIAVTPPTVKSIRGYDSPVSVLDELAVWYQEADSANPDFEIYRQAVSRQAQFQFPKIVGISSPMNMGGLLYKRFQAGTNGLKVLCPECRVQVMPDCPVCEALRRPHRGHIVLYSTTASLGNPLVTQSWLQEKLDEDPKAFERECLAQFQPSISGFLSPALLKEATDVGVLERPPSPNNVYLAAIDPAFRHDAFGFAIGHTDENGHVVIDVIKRWTKEYGEALNPRTVFEEIQPYIKAYRLFSIYTDQYQAESLNQLALEYGVGLDPITFTATTKGSIYHNFSTLLNQKRIRLLDEPILYRELVELEKKLSPRGQVSIQAPEGKHDDLATVVAMVTFKAAWLDPMVPKAPERDPTIFERCTQQANKKWEQRWGALMWES